MSPGRLRILIVDDSAVVRQVLGEALSREPDLDVVGQAMDPTFALARLEKTPADLLVCGLDLQNQGTPCLQKLQAKHPIPVILLSTRPDADQGVLQGTGIVAVLPKPTTDVRAALLRGLSQLVQAVRVAGRRAPNRAAQAPPPAAPPPRAPAPAKVPALIVPQAAVRAVPSAAGIKVMIVDDSAVVRQVLTELLGDAPDIEVIGQAMDPLFALDKMRQLWPDVLILDVEMPRMDGITFLRQIMSERPTPVIICSSLTAKDAETTMQALAAGAFAIVTKPQSGVGSFLRQAREELVAEIRSAAGAKVGRILTALQPAPEKLTADAVLSAPTSAMAETTDRITVIGTSTGGTQALEYVLTALPVTCPGIAVVQHMPEKFTAAFAERLDRISTITVREAQNGDRILPGHALIAPGGRHLVVKRSGAQYRVEVVAAPPVNRHCPSVDVLFRSAAKCAGRNAVGVIMTGMGDDGARGLLEMRQAGARTLAQDEATCVVFGMPKEAIRMGAADAILPLQGIPAQIAR